MTSRYKIYVTNWIRIQTRTQHNRSRRHNLKSKLEIALHQLMFS